MPSISLIDSIQGGIFYNTKFTFCDNIKTIVDKIQNSIDKLNIENKLTLQFDYDINNEQEIELKDISDDDNKIYISNDRIVYSYSKINSKGIFDEYLFNEWCDVINLLLTSIDILVWKTYGIQMKLFVPLKEENASELILSKYFFDTTPLLKKSFVKNINTKDTIFAIRFENDFDYTLQVQNSDKNMLSYSLDIKSSKSMYSDSYDKFALLGIKYFKKSIKKFTNDVINEDYTDIDRMLPNKV